MGVRRVATIGLLAAVGAALLVGGASVAPAQAACKNSDALAGAISPKKGEKAVACLINKERASKGLHRLKNHKALRKAAGRHSRYEDKKNCISHQCPGELDFVRRVQKAGYPGCRCNWTAGEVIGWRMNRLATARSIVDAWLDSPAHRANLLNRKYRHIGVGIAWGSPRASSPVDLIAGIYTVNFGSAKRY